MMKRSVMWRLLFACILAISTGLMSPSTAEALSLDEYFQFSYDPVSFSKDVIEGSEVFEATIAGRATCTSDLPITVNEASITSRVIAVNTATGTTAILNSSYTVSINPFPSKAGDTTEISQVVALQFPAEAESGEYNVTGEIIEATVNSIFGSTEVTQYLPQSQNLGSLKYNAPETAPVLTSAPTPTPEPESTPAPVPAPVTTPAPAAPAVVPPEQGMAWWVWVVVAAAVTTTLFNIIWYLRRRTG